MDELAGSPGLEGQISSDGLGLGGLAELGCQRSRFGWFGRVKM